MMQENHKQSLGRLGEQLAEQILLNKFYTIIERNYHCRFGELDIVAQYINDNKKCLGFFEVKTLSNENFLHLEETLTGKKILRLRRSISSWLIKHPDYKTVEWSLGFIGILLDFPGKTIKKLLFRRIIT